MSEKFGGRNNEPKESALRRQYRIVESERTKPAEFLAELDDDRSEILKEYPESVVDFPGPEDFSYFKEKNRKLFAVDAAKNVIRKELAPIDRKLDKLFDRAWNEAHSEDKIRTYRNSLIHETLPERRIELTEMHNLLTSIIDDVRLSREVSEIVRYMTDIVKRLEELSKSKEFLRRDYIEIDTLTNAFKEQGQRVREKIAKAMAYNNKTAREE